MLTNPTQQLGRHRVAQKLFRGLVAVKAQAFKILALVVLFVAVHVVDVYGNVPMHSMADDAATTAFLPEFASSGSVLFNDGAQALSIVRNATPSLSLALIVSSVRFDLFEPVIFTETSGRGINCFAANGADSLPDAITTTGTCAFPSPGQAFDTVGRTRFLEIRTPATFSAGCFENLIDGVLMQVHATSDLPTVLDFTIKTYNLGVVSTLACRHLGAPVRFFEYNMEIGL